MELQNQSKTGKRTAVFSKVLRIFFLLVIAGFFVSVTPKETQAAAKGFSVENGVGYYYNANGSKHVGWLWLDGKKYLFDENGRQVTGWQDNHYRYFRNTPGAEGYMVTGLYQDQDGKVYYFRPSTGVYARGWVNFEGKYRYFSSKGVMFTGIRKVGNYYYYFAGNVDYTLAGFRWQRGFRNFSDGRYYFSPTTGRGNIGWLQDGDNSYYTNIKGKCYVGVYKVGKYNYYFLEDGRASRGTWNTFNGNTYYFNLKDGHGHIGLLNLNGKQYYFTKEGVLYQNKDVSVNGVKYHADANGVLSKVVSDSVLSYEVKYASNGSVSYVLAHDKNGRDYYVAREFMSHPGVADGTKSDRDLLAAICEAEAGDQGKIGMEAVALCILNRTIKPDREFPSELRYVIYQIQYPNSYPQYSPVRVTTGGGALLPKLNGRFENASLAYEAADEALAIFNAYKANGTKRYLPGFDREDFNFMYFMMQSSFWGSGLNFSKVDYYLYKDHMFFVDWF